MEFNQFKTKVLSRTIAKRKCSISEIQIISDSICKYAGITFKLDKPAFNALLRILGISKSLRNKMIAEFGVNFVDKLIEIMSARTKSNRSELIMLVDVENKTILNFLSSDIQMVSNGTFLNEIEKVIDSYGLETDNYGFHLKDNGGFTVQTLCPTSEWGIKGLKDEVFKFGLTFENDPIKGSSLSPFNQRLVCTNGMTTRNVMHSVELLNTRDSWEHFFNTISTLEDNQWRPSEFGGLIKNGMNFQASVAEVENARNLIKSNSLLDDNTLELYLPYEETKLGYFKAGMDISNFNTDQKKNAKSSLSYWDLINDITYIASNVTGHGVKNRDRLQLYAGELLSKKPDTSNNIDSPF